MCKILLLEEKGYFKESLFKQIMFRFCWNIFNALILMYWILLPKWNFILKTFLLLITWDLGYVAFSFSKKQERFIASSDSPFIRGVRATCRRRSLLSLGWPPPPCSCFDPPSDAGAGSPRPDRRRGQAAAVAPVPVQQWLFEGAGGQLGRGWPYFAELTHATATAFKSPLYLRI